jgi:Domain of unknown function (DUF3471)
VKSIELPVESLAQYAGLYEAPRGENVRIAVDQKQLTASGSLGNVALVATSATTFFTTDGAAQIDFAQKQNGEIEALTVRRESSISPPMMRTVEQAPPFKSTAFYVRGSTNDWSMSAPMSAAANDTFTARIPLKAGSYEFKLGSVDFKAIDFGGSASQPHVSIANAKLLSRAGKNLTINIANDSDYLFTLDATKPFEPTLTVSATR